MKKKLSRSTLVVEVLQLGLNKQNKEQASRAIEDMANLASDCDSYLKFVTGDAVYDKGMEEMSLSQCSQIYFLARVRHRAIPRDYPFK